MNVADIFKAQKTFFQQGSTFPLPFRRQQLQKLKITLQNNEARLAEAIYADFKKSSFETFLTEFALIYKSIDDALKNLHHWARPEKVRISIANQPGQGLRYPEPLGTSLIIGAWNYPYQLTLAPLVAAMAAGNTCIIKPSELTPQASGALAEILNQAFPQEYLRVLEGGVEITQELLQCPFDKIFFTGSTQVGKIVAKAAAEHLSSVTLELGGKSPCLVFADADLKTAAHRILWGKFLNAGQTCVAPDYVLVERKAYAALLETLRSELPQVVGPDPKNSPSYVRIVSEKHTQRLLDLIPQEKIVLGGQGSVSERYIEPTILKDVSFSDKLMTEEIFGPLLPLIPFDQLDEAIDKIKRLDKPLAFYAFTKNQKIVDTLLERVPFGGGCINDTIMHLAEDSLPFGGVGKSGLGCYHGKAGFETFSHRKSVLKKTFFWEPPLRFLPYTDWKQKILRFIFRA